MSSESNNDRRQALRRVYYELWMLFSIGVRILDTMNADSKDDQGNETNLSGYYPLTHTSPPPHVTTWEVSIPEDIVAKNAIVETFAIHTRALLQFFFSEKFRTRDTDIVAEHFFDPSDSWRRVRVRDWDDDLADLRDRVGREIAHITSFRQAYPIEDKRWPIQEILFEIASLARRFLDAVPEHYRPSRWSLEDEISEILGSA
jgi:hypothetical protein